MPREKPCGPGKPQGGGYRKVSHSRRFPCPKSIFYRAACRCSPRRSAKPGKGFSCCCNRARGGRSSRFGQSTPSGFVPAGAAGSVPAGSVPVSYTHLDGYKRQGQNRPFAPGAAACAQPLRRRGKRAGRAFFLPEEKKKPKQSELCFGLCQDVTNDKNSLRCHCSLHYIHDYTEKSVGFV